MLFFGGLTKPVLTVYREDLWGKYEALGKGKTVAVIIATVFNLLISRSVQHNGRRARRKSVFLFLH